MDMLIMAGQLLLGLGILVFIHELGHYMAARAFGIRVEKFYIFFDFGGKKLWSKEVNGCEYGLGWFPLGGYVKISGMIDESMDKEQLQAEPQPWEFRSKPAWQRFIVMIGGITMNIFLGILIFAFHLNYFAGGYTPMSAIDDGIYAYELGREMGFQTGDKVIAINGETPERSNELLSLKVFFGADIKVERNGQFHDITIPDSLVQKLSQSKASFIAFDNFEFKIDSIMPGTGAADGGLQKGDVITKVNQADIRTYGQFKENVTANAGKTASLSILRDSKPRMLNVEVTETGTVGLYASPKQPYKTVEYSAISGLKFGTIDGFEAIYYNALGLGRIFTGKFKARESIQSPIGIAQIYGAEWKWGRFWYLTGLISFILAFMNILPIPALDGGHVVFIFIEMLRGKPVSDVILEKAQVVGMVLLLTLMAFAIGNDILKSFN